MNPIKKLTQIAIYCSFTSIFSQNISQAESLAPVIEKLRTCDTTIQILFLGDSHIQSGWVTEYLRQKFQSKYGNAGRGLVFPYAVANSNGPEDYKAVSNVTWQTFRLVYEQDIFTEMGASGFVMGNHQPSFLEIEFLNSSELFDQVHIFHDRKMQGQTFQVFESQTSLKEYSTRKTIPRSYQIEVGDTFPELAAKFYTTTTRLRALNGPSVQNPKLGTTIKTDEVTIEYNPEFEKQIRPLETIVFSDGVTEIKYTKPTNKFLIKTLANQNIFYGFQFLNKNKGVVFNTVGVNGATYGDFMKYPLQMQHLKTLRPDFVIIALGTNEAVSRITEEEFKSNAYRLIDLWKQENPQLPILLIAPTDNDMAPQKTLQVVHWIEAVAREKQVAFLDLHQAMGGLGYFRKALQRKEANKDKVHFLKDGYESQAKKIWQMLEPLL